MYTHLKNINNISETYQQMFKYLFIGLFASGIDMLIFAWLYNLVEVNSKTSTAISVSIAIGVSFFLNTKFNFRVSNNWIKRLILFYFVGVIGLIISVLIIYVLHDIASINANFAKLASIPMVALVQFALNKYITFSTGKTRDVYRSIQRHHKLWPTEELNAGISSSFDSGEGDRE